MPGSSINTLALSSACTSEDLTGNTSGSDARCVSEPKDGAVGSCRAALPWDLSSPRATPTAQRARAVATLDKSIFHFAVFLTWLFPVSWQKLKLLLVYRAVKVIFMFLIWLCSLSVKFLCPCYPKVPIPVETEKSSLTKKQKKDARWWNSFNLGQPSYRYPPSFVHCSSFKDEKSKGWILHQKSCFFRE